MTTRSWLLDDRQVRLHDIPGGLSAERSTHSRKKSVLALQRRGLQALVGLLESTRETVRIGLDVPGFGPIVVEVTPGNRRAKVRVRAAADTTILRGELLNDHLAQQKPA